MVCWCYVVLCCVMMCDVVMGCGGVRGGVLCVLRWVVAGWWGRGGMV